MGIFAGSAVDGRPAQHDEGDEPEGCGKARFALGQDAKSAQPVISGDHVRQSGDGAHARREAIGQAPVAGNKH